MHSPLQLRLDAHRAEYRPGEVLSGEYRLVGITLAEVSALEVSVLWHTEGKGDEDFAVHFFKRLSAEELSSMDGHRVGRFSTLLPDRPLSYDGVIVKIRWCARLRLFLQRGKELVEEHEFRLGHVPPARAVLP